MVGGVAAPCPRPYKSLPPVLPLLCRRLAEALYPVLVEIPNLAVLHRQRCRADLRAGHPLQQHQEAGMGSIHTSSQLAARAHGCCGRQSSWCTLVDRMA